MKDDKKTKKELVKELHKIQRKLKGLEKSEEEHIQTRRALHDSEEIYKALVRASPDAVTVTDLEGIIIEVSQKTLDMHGYESAHELLGRSAFEFISPQDRVEARRNLEKTLEQSYVGNLEYMLVRKDGTSFIAELDASLIKDCQGNPKGFIATTRDITERKRLEKILGEYMERLEAMVAERTEELERAVNELRNEIAERKRAVESLRESEEKLSALMANSSDITQIVDSEGCITYISPSVERVLGYKPEEIIGRPSVELVHPDDLPIVAEGFKEALQYPDMPVHTVCRCRHKDGTWRVIEGRGINHLEKPTIKGFVANLRDITEQKKLANAIENAATEWRRTFDLIPDLIMVLDSEQRFTRVNKALADALGLSYKQILGTKCSELICQSKKRPEFCPHTRAMRGRKKGYREDRLKRFKAEFAITSTPVINEEGDAIGSVHLLRDITERKRAEKELLEYQEQLRSCSSQLTITEDRERRRVAGLLHDNIGQMLAVSRMKLQDLRKYDSASDYIEAIDELQGLIDETIRDTRTLIFEISPPALYDLGLEPALEQMAEQFTRQYGIQCKLQKDPREKPLDEDVRVILFQAVRELLMNIVKHARADHAEISIQREKGFLKIEIRDNGKGFDYNKINNYKANRSGFGLFNIRERLDRAGGGLEVISEPGKGTTCILTAPLKLHSKSRKKK